MAEQTPKELIDLLCESGPRLRESGVLSIDLGVCKATFSPLEPDQPDWANFVIPHTPADSAMEDEMDALMNPETFGRQAGEGVPGYYEQRDRQLDPDKGADIE